MNPLPINKLELLYYAILITCVVVSTVLPVIASILYEGSKKK